MVKRVFRYILWALVIALSASLGVHAKTIVVGPGERIQSIQQAAQLAAKGDTIELMSAEYSRQPVLWQDMDITIRGIGKRPVITAGGISAEGKAIWVVRNSKMRIENIEFRGARVESGNGAGIRFESGELTVRECAFFDNEMGILTGNVAQSTLEVHNSEFGEAPLHESGALHHLLYVGAIDKFTVTGSRFQQGFRGHLIKSRARLNHISYNLVVDGEIGHASYELEFPNGGIAFVVGNIIGQSQTTENPELISYGAEGARWADNALYLSHNTLINPLRGGRYIRTWNEKFPGKLETSAVNNLTLGYGDLSALDFAVFRGNYHADGVLSSLDDLSMLQPAVHPSRSHPVASAGSARTQSLNPIAEFHLPAGTRPVPKKAPWLAGALQ